MEAALFVPSGTFGNQCAIGVHTSPGDELIIAETAHAIEHEVGAVAALWGVQTRTVRPSSTSYLMPEDVEPRLRVAHGLHEPQTGLILLENALSDGSVMPIPAMEAMAKLAKRHEIPIHLDGARLFNAALALGTNVDEIAAHVDSVTFCLSKGLGAPVGSILCGKTAFIAKARRRRKMMGGGMRQAGILAAAGLVALTEGVQRLGEDHENALLLARSISELPGIAVPIDKVQTNIVFCRVNSPALTEAALVDHLKLRGFDTYPPAWWGLRFVTSSRVTKEDVLALIDAIKDYVASAI